MAIPFSQINEVGASSAAIENAPVVKNSGGSNADSYYTWSRAGSIKLFLHTGLQVLAKDGKMKQECESGNHPA